MSSAPVSLHDFVVVKGRGYRPDQVDAYVDALFRDRDAAWERAARLTVLAKEMEAEAERLREVVAQLAPQTYESLGDQARRLYELVQEEAEAVREGARQEAESLVDKARTWASGLRDAAQAHADALGAEADAYAEERMLAARAEADEIRVDARRTVRDERGLELLALRELRHRTTRMLTEQTKDHGERWAVVEREAEEKLAAQVAAEEDRQVRAETASVEAKQAFADADAFARRVQEEAQARATELVTQARQQSEEIARETERVLREHGEMWDDVRTHIGQMRNSLTALTGQAAME
ncbi:cellulose-binding protein [Streptomyces sp. uw30]|uniref:cellulose-binding protein n=1 Tax=Streptomyces sp. uw30 TaxID=1828179 RepID=UPI0011CEBA97|nr:cellulose-binding protein [Streptomyces sp. uw30]TXS40830.1 cellulose-binding protein [Streptomyces sp. uw30]